jgi:hypothetical protein
MRQFYETYRQKKFVSAVLTQISWTNRNLLPTLIAEYKTKLISKKILQKKLHELFLLQDGNTDWK